MMADGGNDEYGDQGDVDDAVSPNFDDGAGVGQHFYVA